MSAPDEIVFRRRADLPIAAGSAVIETTIDAGGAAVVALTGAAWVDVAGATDPASSPDTGLASSPWPVDVHRWTTGGWSRVLRTEVHVAEPHVVALAGGTSLVVGRYSRRAPSGEAEQNARRLDPDGLVLSRFTVGDGVLDVQEADGGDVWVAYTAEGVTGDYGHRGWGRLSPDLWIEPAGEAGLVRYSPDGRRVAVFAQPEGELPIAGCHALNVWRREVWISYHPAFPLVCLRDGQVSGRWATALPAASDAVAVHEGRVLIHAAPGRAARRCWMGRLPASGQLEATEAQLALDDGTPVTAIRHVIGRGAVLHAFTDAAWYSADLRLL